MRSINYRKKIHGISFQHRSSQPIYKKKKTFLSDYFDLEELAYQIEIETPKSMRSSDIHYLLCDHGRNEINTFVSECVDSISKWTGIIKTMERCFLKENILQTDLFFEEKFSDENIYKHKELEIFLSTKSLVLLWRHRLAIIEMIVEAQGSLRNFPYINKQK
ncbi:hypothetical protein [Fluviispira multicolorata]|uniref:Uncharacterized protein n=1 Tax=Fluviispira multicolorata TaxID=2654512 RepID=A0A833JHZ1_9BACT|nr:hypothetical protein [Fluviispira multicolorata]KAB8033778.1 hypothetical protein GCL57_03460 [Fluviispira multicolorata]